MKDTLQPGLKHTGTLAVLPSMTVPNVSAELTAFADMPPVFATAMMVGLAHAFESGLSMRARFIRRIEPAPQHRKFP